MVKIVQPVRITHDTYKIYSLPKTAQESKCKLGDKKCVEMIDARKKAPNEFPDQMETNG